MTKPIKLKFQGENHLCYYFVCLISCKWNVYHLIYLKGILHIFVANFELSVTILRGQSVMGEATECQAPECPSDRVPSEQVPNNRVPI
jgi:hypothetical protein